VEIKRTSGIGITVFLNEKFIREKLVKPLDPVLRKLPENTKIICPLCKKGTLILKKIMPIYRGGMNPRCAYKEHVGNSYECKCSYCGKRFVGDYRWKWID